jgi:fructose-bisphosphate aldolase class II
MPLVSILNEVRKAQANGYAIPLFDTYEMLSAQGIFAALVRKQAPGIVAVYSNVLDRPNSRAFVEFLRIMAAEAAVPVSIMLDHGASFEQCVKALSYGFTDVMYDGSSLSLEENITATSMVVRAAHAVGAAVEAELGHVGEGHTYQAFGAKGEGFTDPETVERFIEETGVDLLAIAIGTAHGQYAGEPKISLDLLAKIRERVDIPLVLHGGSGLTDEQYKASISKGISKINIFTDLSLEAKRRIIQTAQTDGASYFDLMAQIRPAFRDRCEYYLDVFGATGKAD